MKVLPSTLELQGVTSRPDSFPAYPLHLHANMEIHHVTEGFRTIILHQQTYRVEKGDLMVVFPFQPHEFPNANEGFGHLICCHPLSIDSFATRLLTLVPTDPLIPADRVPPRLRTLLSLINSTPKEPHRGETLTALFTAFFLELLDIMPLTSKSGMRSGDAERLLVTCMNDCRSPEFSLESLARTCGMSTRTVSRFFNERMDITFPRFIAMLRLHYALDQMKNRVSITEAALSSGFGSVCSFNRAFRAEYGIAPREYIRRSLADSDK